MKKLLALLLALVMCMSLLVACGPKNPGTETPSPDASETDKPGNSDTPGGEVKYKDTVVIGYASDTATADPYMDSSTQLKLVANMTFRSLTSFDQPTGVLSPELATEWSANTDSTVWTFKLRHDVKFHDGTDFNADDVLFSLERATDGDQVKVPASTVAAVYESAKAIDPYTIEITLSSPCVDFPYVMADLFIYSKDAFDAGVENAGYIGCGPYKWAGQEIGVSYTLDAFDDFYGGRPVTNHIMFKVMPEVDSQIAALQADEINVSLAVRATDIPVLEADADVNYTNGAGATVYFMVWNGGREIANNKLVTDAVAMALDKEAMNIAMFSGNGVVTHSMTGNTAAPGYVDVGEPFPYNVEEAKKLLDQAGYGEGELTLTMMYYAWCKPFAEMTQACLGEIGINVEMKEVDGSVFRAMAEEGQYDLTVTYCGLSASVNYMSNRFFAANGGGNWWGYAPTAEIQAQLNVCAQQTDLDKLLAESAKLQQLCAKDSRYIPIVMAPMIYGYSANLQGFNMPMSSAKADFSTLYIIEK